MAFLDKLKETAKTIGDKTGDVIESGKLHAKISGEKGDIKDAFLKIGELVYNAYLEGNTPDVSALCESIKVHYENIAVFEKEIENIKKEEMKV